jgi:hypothetical protein
MVQMVEVVGVADNPVQVEQVHLARETQGEAHGPLVVEQVIPAPMVEEVF